MNSDTNRHGPPPLFPYVKDVGTDRVRLAPITRERLRRLLGREVRIVTERDLALAVVDGLRRAIFAEIRDVVSNPMKDKRSPKDGEDT